MKHHLKHPATLAVSALAIIGLVVTALVALPSEASPAPTLPRPTTTVVAKVREARAAEAIRDRRAEAAERAKHKAAVDHLNRVRLLLALQQNRRADSLREIARQRQVAAEAAQAAAKAAAKASQARAPRPVGPAPAASQGTGRCGGNLPPCCVMNRESGGNIHAQNPHSTASGKWQFLNSTWNGFGGYASAAAAPESVQDAKAAQLWAGGAGASHWGGGC